MIYLYGDTHGDMEINKIAPIKQYTSEDVIIVLGDFGFPFYPKEYAKKLNYTKTYDYWCRWLSTLPCDILFVDGNHDNHDFWAEQPTEERYNGIVQPHPDITNCYHLMRGEVYTIQGKTFLTFGGAHSTDKGHRKEGISWWAGEDATDDNWNNYCKNIEKVDFKVDYILSHTCPKQIMWEHYYFDLDITSTYLQQIMNEVQYDEWYCGHFHIDGALSPKDKVYCVYNNPIKIEEEK